MDSRLNVKPKMVNLLEENIVENLYNLGKDYKGKDSLGSTPKAWPIKEKTYKLNFIKIKKLCTSKDTIRKYICKPQNKRNIWKAYTW